MHTFFLWNIQPYDSQVVFFKKEKYKVGLKSTYSTKGYQYIAICTLVVCIFPKQLVLARYFSSWTSTKTAKYKFYNKFCFSRPNKIIVSRKSRQAYGIFLSRDQREEKTKLEGKILVSNQCDDREKGNRDSLCTNNLKPLTATTLSRIAEN